MLATRRYRTSFEKISFYSVVVPQDERKQQRTITKKRPSYWITSLPIPEWLGSEVICRYRKGRTVTRLKHSLSIAGLAHIYCPDLTLRNKVQGRIFPRSLHHTPESSLSGLDLTHA